MRGCVGHEQAEQALEEEKEVHASALEVERTERQRQQHFFDQVPCTPLRRFGGRTAMLPSCWFDVRFAKTRDPAGPGVG